MKWHDPKATLAEGLVSRGDRRLGPVIEEVWRRGGTFQEWSEQLRPRRCGTRPWPTTASSADWYVHRHRTEDEVLPWDHLSAGLHKDFLWQDWRDALAEVGLPDCRWTPCYDCGACTGYSIEHIVASATPPAGGSQGTGQDLSASSVPVTLLGRKPVEAGASGGPVRIRVRFRKLGQGPLHQPPRRGPLLGAGAAPRRAARRVHRGLLAPTRSCTSGSPSPPATSRWGSTSTST